MSEQYSPEQIAGFDREHVWHPFTEMKAWMASRPITVARGDGVRLFDLAGRAYFDGTSSIWLNVHGHRVPEIDAAIRAQLDLVAHSTLLGLANVPSSILAKRLADVAPPGLTRVLFSSDGACAVEAAIKIAVQYHANRGETGRRFVLGFTENYHGDTLGAVGVAPDPLFHQAFTGLLPGHPRAPYPYCYRCPVGRSWHSCETACFEAVEKIVSERSRELAGILIEPVQGAGGIIPSPPGYLARLRKLADEHGILLLVDEVATGMGRTGRLLATEADGITPDILCLGKGLSGGYLPLAATLATEHVFSAFLGDWAEKKSFFHGHSFTGNPLACAAGIASLDLLLDLLPSLPAKGELLDELLLPLSDHPFVGDVRRAGLMVGIELVTDPETKHTFPFAGRAGYRVTDRARERGLLVRPIGNVVIFMPPLASSPEELREMASILVAAFGDAREDLAAIAEVEA